MNEINSKIEEFFSIDALDAPSELTMSIKDSEKNIIMGQKVMLFVSSKEMKTKKEIHPNVAKTSLSTIKKQRTQTISKHIPKKIRNAVDNFSDRHIYHDLDFQFDFDHELSEKYEKEERMIQDLYYNQELKPILNEIKIKYGHKVPDYNTRDSIKRRFLEAHNTILLANGGLICSLSQKQIKAFDQLSLWFLGCSPETYFSKKSKEWIIFATLENSTTIIRATTVKSIEKGKFSIFMKRYKNRLKTKNKSSKEIIKDFEDWIRGVGAYKTKRKRPGTGGSLDVICVITDEKYSSGSTEMEYPEMTKGNYKIINLKEARKLLKSYLS